MASATLTVSAIVAPGWKFTTFSSPVLSDTYNIAYSLSPTIVSSDMVVFSEYLLRDGVTSSYSLTISTDGSITFFTEGNEDSVSFIYFIWDESTSSYGSQSYYSTSTSSSTTASPVTTHDIYEWLYESGTSGGVMQRTKYYLNSLGYVGNTNKMMFNWLRGLGYTGTLTNMIDKFERDNTDAHG